MIELIALVMLIMFIFAVLFTKPKKDAIKEVLDKDEYKPKGQWDNR